jgi:hypothetical protein
MEVHDPIPPHGSAGVSGLDLDDIDPQEVSEGVALLFQIPAAPEQFKDGHDGAGHEAAFFDSVPEVERPRRTPGHPDQNIRVNERSCRGLHPFLTSSASNLRMCARQ